ncbi:F0F1 ATP synthase subunit C [Streptococcus parauberis]|uniref:ATP synthase subunit c n=2 Tax=Streptococcus parauberis TaxID=1348 RepID=A0A0E2UBU1_9STRE|nr:F0F1 ATP synthase subunit C [Streptococcus parauberis]AEF24942.1 ATP synthase C chain [Streptococcus parauberis KCTC 11537]AUT05719.1 ATP synthase subunit [Streptococcus parauberis]EMF49525.1 ATP synthase C chain [Streptococcus parauberis KRS-02109]EMG26196.1 ATP synthase C chain [Streptococcus parauberis KRS-02083]KYP16716.1 ATP synthase subunit c [Streptococcus parauberis]
MTSFFALALACIGVTLGESFLIANLFKSAARQPEIMNQLRSIMILGIAFIEGTFFVTLAMAFILK